MSELNLLDYINQDELAEFYGKIQNLFPVCIKCQKPVLIKNIKEDKTVKMQIDCPFCQNSEKLILKEYINKLESLIPEKKNCNTHTDKLSYGFCQDCNRWLCKECFIEHVSTNHIMYQSQFKIRPTCIEHPNEKASFYNEEKDIYLCNKCDFKPQLEKLTNAFFYNLQGDAVLSHCYRCLHYDFIITEAKKDLNKLNDLIEQIITDKCKDNELAKEKTEKVNNAYNLIYNNIAEVRFNNILIANSYLKSMPNYHIFKNIKNNFGENHKTFWGFNDMIYEIKDKEANMTKETLLELIDKFIDICENNLTTGTHNKLSEENMFNFVDESDLKIKEMKCCKIEHDDISNGFLLEKNKSFLIHGNDYFTIYDSNTFEILQEVIFLHDRISYINIIDNKRFIISFNSHYEYYELKDNKYQRTKSVKLQKVNLDEFKKEMGIEDNTKEKKKKNAANENDDSDDDDDNDDISDNDSNSEGKINAEDINSNSKISAIALLKDETKIACGQGSLISIREFETGKLIKTLVKHEGEVNILFMYNNYLVSCCTCNNLCFWDLNTFELKKMLDAEISSPTSYIIIENYFSMLTGGGMIGYLIDLNKLKVNKDFSGDFMLLNGLLQINEDEVLIATEENSTSSNNFYLMNLYDMEPELHIKNVHNNICEGCFKIDDKRFVSVSRDCTFKVWSIKDEDEED